MCVSVSVVCVWDGVPVGVITVTCGVVSEAGVAASAVWVVALLAMTVL